VSRRRPGRPPADSRRDLAFNRSVLTGEFAAGACLGRARSSRCRPGRPPQHRVRAARPSSAGAARRGDRYGLRAEFGRISEGLAGASDGAPRCSVNSIGSCGSCSSSQSVDHDRGRARLSPRPGSPAENLLPASPPPSLPFPRSARPGGGGSGTSGLSDDEDEGPRRRLSAQETLGSVDLIVTTRPATFDREQALSGGDPHAGRRGRRSRRGRGDGHSRRQGRGGRLERRHG